MTAKGKASIRRILGSCLSVLVMLCSVGPGLAFADNSLTVAYTPGDNFFAAEADGSLSGYGADYLAGIARYTGWEYELVALDREAALEALKSGAAELYCFAGPEERDVGLALSPYPAGNEQLNLYALPGSDLYYEDFLSFDGMRIAMPQGGDQAAYLESYAQAKGFSYSLELYPDNESAIAALRAGRADAVALMGYYGGEPLKMVGNFALLPVYVMGADDSLPLRELADAQKQLYLDEPSFVQSLESAYSSGMRAGGDLLLTREEAAYIASAGTLTVAMSVDMAPMEYFDEASGSFRGVTVDLYRRVSELTGLEFEFVRRPDAPELIERMDRGEIQLIGALAQNENVARSLQIFQTKTFYDNSMSAVTKDFSALGPASVVAVPAGYPQFVETARANGYESFIEYATFEECVAAVYRDEADLTYIISMCESYLLSHAQYGDLRAVVGSGTEYGVCLGVSMENALLYSILNKALSAIPGRDVDEIIVSNTARAEPEQTVADTFVENGGVIFAIAVVLFALLTFSIVRFQRYKQQQTLTRELQQHHDLLERLYESLPCGVFRYEYEPPHRILSYNEACARIYGYDDGFPAAGRLPEAVVKAGTESAFQREFDRCESAGGAISYVWPITRRDGSEAYTESVMDIVDTSQGKVFQEIIIDVTERILKEKEMETRYAQEVHKSGNRAKGMIYMAFFDVTEQTLVETDMPLPGLRPGVSIDDFIQTLRDRLEDVQTAEELERFAAQFDPELLEREYDSGQYEHTVTLRRCVDGQIQWLRSDIVLRYNPTTGHLMCFDYIWDVTDEYVTGAIARRMTLADFESFMSVYVRTGCCLEYEVEPSGEHQRSEVRYGESDVICRLCSSMGEEAAAELRRDTELSLVERRLSEKPLYQVYATVYDDGERRDKSLSFFYMDSDIGILAVTVADVTEVRAAEVRHGQLLSEALAAAEKAGMAKSQFLSRVSHEIRTPLNAVIGYSTIARSEMAQAKTDAERRQAEMKVMDCLTKSDVASKHLLTIINDVLDMSAIESGKISIARERFDFKGLINSLTTVFYSQARAKDVELHIRFSAQMDEWVVGDQMRVNQILTNLLSNAIKFTPEGGRVLLDIRPEMTDSAVNVTFTVADTGIGMSQEYLSHIWEPFEQADAYISRRFGGTGLGLTITKTLVDLMDGEISVESTLGQGSKFTVKLSFGRTEQPPQRSSYDFSNMNALIVDDDRGACDYLGLLLSRYNVRSTAVHSGLDALAAIESAMERGEGFTVCFVDWRMPQMDGLETARRVREISGADMPIIVITAYDFSEVVGRSAELGVNRFLSKPLFQSSLFDLLAELCGSPRATGADRLSDYDFAGRRLLLAEDNAMNMEIADRILESAGFTVDRAWNGKEAVDAFEGAPQGTYKAILMDVQMPVMDGYQATRTIRASAHPEAGTIPIIAMTADAFAENIAESLAAGMNDHISKPIDLTTLFAALKKYTSGD